MDAELTRYLHKDVEKIRKLPLTEREKAFNEIIIDFEDFKVTMILNF